MEKEKILEEALKELTDRGYEKDEALKMLNERVNEDLPRSISLLELIEGMMEHKYSLEDAMELALNEQVVNLEDSTRLEQEVEAEITGIDAISGYAMLEDVGTESTVELILERLREDNKIFNAHNNTESLCTAEDWNDYMSTAADEKLAEFQEGFLETRDDPEDWEDYENYEEQDYYEDEEDW